ncbi:hypothetical protein AB6A40_008719 [Gnathostoma spinigerum]|uniref:Uncharacterized protein n=1 Tax=Gnathostoma spinigerum TaxID=75299 RepID=A0ABD6EPW3_9BILA
MEVAAFGDDGIRRAISEVEIAKRRQLYEDEKLRDALICLELNDRRPRALAELKEGINQYSRLLDKVISTQTSKDSTKSVRNCWTANDEKTWRLPSSSVSTSAVENPRRRRASSNPSPNNMPIVDTTELGASYENTACKSSQVSKNLFHLENPQDTYNREFRSQCLPKSAAFVPCSSRFQFLDNPSIEPARFLLSNNQNAEDEDNSKLLSIRARISALKRDHEAVMSSLCSSAVEHSDIQQPNQSVGQTHPFISQPSCNSYSVHAAVQLVLAAVKQSLPSFHYAAALILESRSSTILRRFLEALSRHEQYVRRFLTSLLMKYERIKENECRESLDHLACEIDQMDKIDRCIIKKYKMLRMIVRRDSSYVSTYSVMRQLKILHQIFSE